MHDIALLVLNWNGAQWLERCLAAATKTIADVWLVDNGSSDHSLHLVRERFPNAQVLALGRNYGFGAAYNRAVQIIDAPFIALLNNDTEVQPGWVEHLVAAVNGKPSAAAVGSKLLQMDRPASVSHAGGRLTPLGAAYDVGLTAADGPGFGSPGAVGCATGAAMLLRRDVFLEVGGFDERYFAYFDDADLCWRFWLAGYTVQYAPEARVLHAYGGSSDGGRLSPFRIEHCQTNRLQNMFKHLETRTLLAMLPVSLAYDAARVLQLLSQGRVDGVRALMRGTRRFGHLLPQVMGERRRIQSTRKRSDGELLRLGVLASLSDAAQEWRRLGGLSMAPQVQSRL